MARTLTPRHALVVSGVDSIERVGSCREAATIHLQDDPRYGREHVTFVRIDPCCFEPGHHNGMLMREFREKIRMMALSAAQMCKRKDMDWMQRRRYSGGLHPN